MPIWRISHNPSLFTTVEERQAIAQKATDFYTSIGIPDYYVNIQFWPLPAAQFFTGGRAVSNLVFVEVYHVARNWDRSDLARATRLKDNIDAVLLPHTRAKGVNVEYAVFEGPPELWRINGIDPPESFREERVEERAEAKRKLDEWRNEIR